MALLPRSRASLRLNVLNLLSQPGEHPAPGDVDSPDRHPQGPGDFGCLLALNGSLPERLPGRVLEAAAHLLGGPGEQPLVVLPLPLGGFRIVGSLLQEPLHVRVATALRVAPPALQEIA